MTESSLQNSWSFLFPSRLECTYLHWLS